MDKECRFRHPKNCKHGQHCKFYNNRNNCLFSHKVKKDLKKEEFVKLEREVEELKSEISNLKNIVIEKELELDKMVKVKEEQNKRLENLKKERADLDDKSRKQAGAELCQAQVSLPI